MIQFFLSVLLNVCFEVGGLVAWKCAMPALVGFLPTVNEGVGLQVIITDWLTKWLVALQTTVLLDPIVSMLVMSKATPSCNYFRTQITRYLFLNIFIYHLLFLLHISYDSCCLPQMTNFPFTFTFTYMAHHTTLKKDKAPNHLNKVLHSAHLTKKQIVWPQNTTDIFY